MARYDLYKSLSLSTASSTEDLAAQLDSRIATLRAQGIQDHQAELQEPLTARAILGDPSKRETYDRMLADPTGPEIGIQQLRELASHNPWAAPKTTSFDSAKQFSQQAIGNFQTKIAAEAVGKPLPANAGLRESWKGSPTMVKVLAILCFVIAGLNLIRFMVWMFGIGEFTSAFKKELSSSSASSSSTLCPASWMSWETSSVFWSFRSCCSSCSWWACAYCSTSGVESSCSEATTALRRS